MTEQPTSNLMQAARNFLGNQQATATHMKKYLTLDASYQQKITCIEELMAVCANQHERKELATFLATLM